MLKSNIEKFFAPPESSKIIKERDHMIKLYKDMNHTVTLDENSYNFYIENKNFKALMEFEEPDNYAYDRNLNWVEKTILI